jgi:hypothetical protein
MSVSYPINLLQLACDLTNAVIDVLDEQPIKHRSCFNICLGWCDELSLLKYQIAFAALTAFSIQFLGFSWACEGLHAVAFFIKLIGSRCSTSKFLCYIFLVTTKMSQVQCFV